MLIKLEAFEEWKGVVFCFKNGYTIKGVMKLLEESDDRLIVLRTDGDTIEIMRDALSAIISTNLFDPKDRLEGQAILDEPLVKKWYEQNVKRTEDSKVL